MRSCCKLFCCFKMYLKQIFFERYLTNFWDLLTRISLPIHCFSFSPVQTPMHPPPTSPPPHRLVATVELTPYTHLLPHLHHLQHPPPLEITDATFMEPSFTYILTSLARTRWNGRSTGRAWAPVVRPSLDCPGLVWRATAGQRGGRPPPGDWN